MQGSKVLEKAVLLRLSFSRAGAVRKADLGQVATDADKRRMKAQKVLFVSREYAAIQSFDNSLSSWVQSRAVAVDVGLKGVWILPLALLAGVDERLQSAEVERAALVSAFLAVYDAERDNARASLNGQFKESDFPPADDVRAQFAIRWSYIQFGPADGLPPDVAERERAKLADRFNQVEADVQEALRVGLLDLVSHLTDRLQVGADGKKMIFRNSAVENLAEFLELFSARNVTGDKALAELAEKAQAVIKGVSPEALRDKRAVRESVKAGLESVKAAVSALIESAPRRKFNLDD